MIIKDEDPATYHARPAVSAGLLWDIVKPEGCLALARWNSPWLNPDYVPERDEITTNGTLAHLAVLEKEKLDERIVVVDASNWRTKAAQIVRDAAYEAGKLPILFERDPGSDGPSFLKLMKIREALEGSIAAPMLFGPGGDNEVSYTFESDGVPCKCRVDRVMPERSYKRLLDLKTAASASPEFFQRSMWSWGHHLRAAFYTRGWNLQNDGAVLDYLFVVVQRNEPFIVSVYRIDADSLVWGEKMVDAGLARFKQAQRSGQWSDWMLTAQPYYTVSLPTWAWHQLADKEAEGEL
jgi:hypothetical protein